MTTQARTAAAAFRATHGTPPAGVWSAPGRINLIGEHTDYNDGFVLPFALPKRIAAAATARTDGILTLASTEPDGTPQQGDSLRVTGLSPGDPAGWQAYPAGVAWALRKYAPEHSEAIAGGADIVLAGDVPAGAGLSSSAAVECAVAMALLGAHGRACPDRAERARIATWAQRAENEFVGAPTGILDQMAAMCCSDGHALFFDIRSGESETVPFAPASAGLAVLVIDTRTKHSHAESGYGDRRRGTERAARLLGLRALRDVSADDLPSLLPRLPRELHGLVRHVLTENQRVLDTVELLRAGRVRDTGALLDASHESLRHDYRVSSSELDQAVDAAREGGALGARMTGGGFGGSAIALVAEDRLEEVRDSVQRSFGAAGFDEPRLFTALPAPGARRDEV